MEREAAEGVSDGDAILLSNLRSQIPDELMPPQILEIENKMGVKIAVHNYKSNVSADARKATEIQFAKNLHRFVRGSLNFIEVEPVQTGAQMIDQLLPSHAFVILKTGNVTIYDADAYDGFGKMGRRDIPKENIYATVSPKEIEVAWADIRSEYESKQTDPAFDKAIEDAVCRLVAQKLKEIDAPEPEEPTLLV